MRKFSTCRRLYNDLVSSNSNGVLANCLDKELYLIPNNLHQNLYDYLGGRLHSEKILKNRKGIYLVCFRRLNKETNVIIYNYIYYPVEFYTSIIVYLLFRDYYINNVGFKEWGYYLVVLDNVFLGNSQFKERYIDMGKDNNLGINLKWLYEDVVSGLMNLNDRSIVPIDLVIELITKLLCIGDYNSLSSIASYAFNKDYVNYVNAVLGSYWKSNTDSFSNGKNAPPNIINGILFVVEDLDYFIKSVANKGFVVNQGPNSFRGQINSMSSFLGNLDVDYRSSLFNHYNYHISKGQLHSSLYDYKLKRQHFSFTNIHQNIGNTRWYSTKRTIKNYKEISPKVLIDRAEDSLKKESSLFNQLSVFLQNSPINYDTQLKIEKFLLDFSYASYKHKDNVSPIDFNLISAKFANYLSVNEAILNNYIDRTRSKIFTKEPNRNRSVVNWSQYHLNNILQELDNKLIISIMYGRLLRIVTNYNRLNYDNSGTDINFDIGNDLVRNYYYYLYCKYICKSITLFLNKYEGILNDIEIESFKKDIDKVKLSMKKLDKSEISINFRKLINEMSNYFAHRDDIDISEAKEIINYSLSQWKEDNKSIIDRYEIDALDLKVALGAKITDWMMEAGILDEKTVVKGLKEKNNTFIPTEDVLNTLKDIDMIVSLPRKIPMIVKPKAYSREIKNGKTIERLGGFLLNDENFTDSLIKDKWEMEKSSIIQDENLVYDLVNNISSVGFKINKDVFDFVSTYDMKYVLLLNKDKNALLTKSKLTKSEKVKLESFLSQFVQQENILGLAEVLSNLHEFFIPVRVDFRGRMNCVVDYLNYQSSELAKSLLLFSKPEKILKSDTRAINYFKAYGANCYGNKLDKKSWNDRVKWVDNNIESIINFRESNLIQQAENKFLFIAFCFEFNRWVQALHNNEIDYFETYLPIQLDASCNGFQHLSLLSSDYNLAKQLNLTKSTWNDPPKDFYGYLGTKLIEYFRNKLKYNNLSVDEAESYTRLSVLTIARIILKKAIMTTPYNVSARSMTKYIQNNFELCTMENKEVSVYQEKWYFFIGDSKIKLRYRDFNLISKGIREVLSNDVFKLNKILKYLKDIARICTWLNLYISWITPLTGINVNQSYLIKEEVRLRPFSYSKTSYKLKIPNKEGKYNLKKQRLAFMPNLVHSLDAAALACLADLYFNSSTSKNFYAIHDCFAVTASNVQNIMDFLELVYVKIYTENSYLRQFDQHIKDHIKKIYHKEFNDKTNIITVENLPEIAFPDINEVLEVTLNSKDIKGSSYLMH